MSVSILQDQINEQSRIMVVDGSKLVRKLITDVLRQELPKAEVICCTNIAEAQLALQKAQVDLVTTSMVLPDGDGFQLAKIVRETSNNSHIPIIVVSGNTQQLLLEHGLDASVTDYFDKSLGHQALAIFIRGYVQLQPMPGSSVLYVEDSRVVIEVTKRILERQALNVIHVSSAEDAFAILTAESLGQTIHPVNLVLTDLTLRGHLGGREVVQQIRDKFGYDKKQLPILVMTGDTHPETQSELIGLGANDLIHKPIEERLLAAKILFQLRLAKMYAAERQ